MLTDQGEMRRALHALRARRLRRRIRQLDWIDALYKAYVVGIVVVASLFTAAALVGDRHLAPTTLRDLTTHGPAVIGTLFAFGVALGLRSGSHGGPLAFEAADVYHLLLAPIDRGLVVRSAAYKQVRGVLTMAALVGALGGLLLSQRMAHVTSGDVAEWIIAGMVALVAAALLVWGAALVASGRRLSPAVATGVGVAAVAWSVADVAAGTTTSPASWLGTLALFPLHEEVGVLVGLVVTAVVVVAGLRLASGISIEAAQQRAGLVTAMRFAATIQDLRVVILLHRQLAQERSRARPWVRIPRRPPVGRACWRRDWQGIVRWPTSRVVRVAFLSIVAGLAAAGTARGTTPLIVVAGIAAYIAGLDAVEGIAEEMDHPERAFAVPDERGELWVRHLVAPTFLIFTVGLLGWLSAVLVDPGYAAVGAVTLISVSLLTVTSGALAVFLAAPEVYAAVAMIHPGLGMARQFVPPVLTLVGFLPVIAAREVTGPHASPFGAAVGAALPAFVISAGIIAYLRSRKTVAF